MRELYSMVRNSQPWELGEPECDDRGQPLIYDIASRLGCIWHKSDLPPAVHLVSLEDGGLADLTDQLKAAQQERESQQQQTESSCNRADRTSSPEPDHSGFEQDWTSVFGGGNTNNDSITLSTQGLTYNDFALECCAVSSPTIPVSASAAVVAQSRAFMDMNLQDQYLLESNFGTAEPHSQPYLDMEDPLISGYDAETLRM